MLDNIAYTTIHLRREWSVFADGTVLPVVRGGGDPVDPPAPAPAPPAPAVPPAPSADGTFTQEQVNALVAKERRETEAAATRKLTETLGMDPAEAAAAIAKAKEAELAAMGEADRKLAEAAERESKAEAREAAAAAREHESTVRDLLVESGVPASKAKTAVRLLDVKAGDDDATIKAAIEAVKVDWPEMFTAEVTPPKPAPSGLPGGNPPKPGDPKNSADALVRGKDRAAKLLERRGGKPVTAGAGQ